MPRKRKRGPAVFSDAADASTNNGFGVAQTLATVRGDVPPGNTHADTDAATETAPDGGWQTVPSRKELKRRKKRVNGEKVKYPSLTYGGGRLRSAVRVSDLQELVLYCLADGVAPQWISVRHSGHVGKVVVLMVPGLERGMFDGSVPLDGIGGGGARAESVDDERKEREEREADNSEFRRWMRGESPVTGASGQFDPLPLGGDSKIKVPPTLQPLARLFPHVWPVRAPGDRKYNKVHSPLQAMLLSALPKGAAQGGGGGGGKPLPPAPSSGHSQRTRITDFLLTADELRENDYELHPAVVHRSTEGQTSHHEKEEEEREVEEGRKRRALAGQTTERDGWVDTAVGAWADGTVPESEIPSGSVTAGREVLAVDCEMCVTEGGASELARISVVGWDGAVVLDELVQPGGRVVDYLTRYSGMTAAKLAGVTTTLADIQARLGEVVHARTILVGHSLQADLKALRMRHPFVVDTAVLYPHPRGPPLKSSLKWLAQRYLGRRIQSGNINEHAGGGAGGAGGGGHGPGHDSVEDARATLALVQQKCEKGPDWGTGATAQGTESVFTRLARGRGGRKPQARAPPPAKTGAVVDWGRPERGLGGQGAAAVTVGCEDDDDAVVAGVDAVLRGDPSSSVPVSSGSVPAGGVDFAWARLRELELARGWCDSTCTSPSTSDVVGRTVRRIEQVWATVPPRTLVVVYSGTGDPRRARELQEQRRRYQREFRGGRAWETLSVRWTDVEEQGLRRAVERARDGCALLAVK